MKQQIIHVGKLQAAKVVAAMYLFLGMPLALVMKFAPDAAGGFTWGKFFMLVGVYVVAGAVASFLGAWLYNGIARLIGGIEFTVVEIDRH